MARLSGSGVRLARAKPTIYASDPPGGRHGLSPRPRARGIAPYSLRSRSRTAARGGEAVVFVETVRLYHDMLKRISRDEYKQLLPPDYQIKLNAW